MAGDDDDDDEMFICLTDGWGVDLLIDKCIEDDWGGGLVWLALLPSFDASRHRDRRRRCAFLLLLSLLSSRRKRR